MDGAIPVELDCCGDFKSSSLLLFVAAVQLYCVLPVSYTHLTLPTICSV